MNNEKFFILREVSSGKTPEIIEEHNGNGDVVIRAVLQDLDTYNRNMRKYKKILLETSLRTSEIQELMEAKSWFGEFGHPLTDDVRRQVTIDNKFISHEIRKTWFEGNILKGEIHSCDTQYGRDFAALVRRGTKVAFSLRALGKLVKSETKPGAYDVVDPFRAITYDCVILPSHKTAYQEEVLSENGIILPNHEIKVPVGHKVYMDNLDNIRESAIAVDLATFVAANSDNVKTVQETLEFAYENIRLSHDGSAIILESKINHAELIVPLENHVSLLARENIRSIFKK